MWQSCIEFRVYGEPRPQGSKRAFIVNSKAKGKPVPVIVEQGGDGLKDWRRRVAAAVQTRAPHGGPITGPVRLQVTFFLQPPQKKTTEFPTKTPDLSKLVRALEDELSKVLIRDDAQIVALDSWKVWANADAPPGAVVKLSYGRT